MFSARFATILAATNSSLGIVICFFDNLGLEGGASFYIAQLFVLFSALSIIFFAHFQQKMAIYSSVIDNVYFVISS